MWQEARKQEKKLRGMMVDHKKRAERRREYYEHIRQDPTQFLQVHGRQTKIHIDPQIAALADDPKTIMPWQGDSSVTIDRFDGRAHLDFIAEFKPAADAAANDEDVIAGLSSKERREVMYERYRILVQNDFLKIPEEKFLRTIELEERFGGKTYQAKQSKEDKKKAKAAGKGAAIGFVYEDSTPSAAADPADEARPVPQNLKGAPAGGPQFREPEKPAVSAETPGGGGDSDSDSDLDLDISVDIMALSGDARKEINKVGKSYELGREDFIKYLARDIEEQEEARAARQQEEEKAKLSGRKSRRDRRMIARAMRRPSPPVGLRPFYSTSSSASRPSKRSGRRDKRGGRSSSGSSSRSRSRSKSPGKVEVGKVEFITSFGGESDSGAKSSGNEGDNDGKKKKAQAVSRLKKLRKDSEEPATSGIVFGPATLTPSAPSPRDSRDHRRRRSRSSSPRRRRRSRSHSRGSRRRRSRSRSRDGGRRRRRRSRSRSRSSSPRRRERRRGRARSRSRSRSRSNEERSRKAAAAAVAQRKKESDSDSSSSEDEVAKDNNGTEKYRSKYRNRRRSSSSSSAEEKEKEEDGNGVEKSVEPEKTVEPPIKKEEDKKDAKDNTKEEEAVIPVEKERVPVVRGKYYGRYKGDADDSESELSVDDDDSGDANGSMAAALKRCRDEQDGSREQSNKEDLPTSFSLKDKIRKKMQAQIRKQFKIDKQAEEERKKRQEEEQRSREDELRELSDRLRKRERDKRRPEGGSANRSASPHSGNSDDDGGGNDEGARRKSASPAASSPPPARRRRRSTRSPSSPPPRHRRRRSRSREGKRRRRSRSRSRSAERRSRKRHSSGEGSSKIPKLVDY